MAREVLIVGAGPTGLVLAVWLARLGMRIRIIDKAEERGTTSRALAVQVRTLELYRQLGFAGRRGRGGSQVCRRELLGAWKASGACRVRRARRPFQPVSLRSHLSAGRA